MKLFLDTANIEEIKRVNDMGIICGVTTNPSLIAKEGKDFKETVKQIAEIVDGPISGEVSPAAISAEQMINEAREISAIHPNMVVKVPMTEEGLKACNILSKDDIKVNMTLIFSANQALLCANAGAAFVSPFIGRIDDIGTAGINLIGAISKIFHQYCINTEIIAASIRNPLHVTEAALSGADIATVPYKVIMQMIKHPLTDIGIDKFKTDYEKVFA